MTKLYRVILNLKAIQMACISSAQDNPDDAIVNMDKEAQEALDFAVKELEKKYARHCRKNTRRVRWEP